MPNSSKVIRAAAYAILFSIPLIFSACSNNEAHSEKFHTELMNADKAINQMNPDEAIEIYQMLLDEFLDGNTYEAGRKEIVLGLKATAESLSGQIQEMDNAFEDVERRFHELDVDSELSAFREFLNDIDSVSSRFHEFSDMERYKELEAYQVEIDQLLEEEIYGSYRDDFDEALAEEDIATAELHHDELKELHDWFPGVVSEIALASMEYDIEEVKERYIRFPETISSLDFPIHSDERGTITVHGYDSENGMLHYYFYLDEDFAKLSNRITLDGRLILADGNVITSSSSEIIRYDESALKRVSFSMNDRSIRNIVRMNISLPMVDENEIPMEMNLSGNETEVQLNGIRSIKALHRPEWGISSDEFDVSINRLFVDDRSIEISGVITPHVDQEISTFSSLHIAETGNNVTRNRRSNTTELFKGTNSDFTYEYSLTENLNEFHEFAILELFGHDVILDLTTGEEHPMDEPVFIDQIETNTDRLYQARYHSDHIEGLINESGDFADADSFSKIGNASSSFYLRNNFSQLTAKIHVHESTAGIDYGSTIIQFTDGEEIIHEVHVEEDFNGYTLDLNVSDLFELEIKTNSNRGSEGRQLIIFENAYLQ